MADRNPSDVLKQIVSLVPVVDRDVAEQQAKRIERKWVWRAPETQFNNWHEIAEFVEDLVGTPPLIHNTPTWKLNIIAAFGNIPLELVITKYVEKEEDDE